MQPDCCTHWPRKVQPVAMKSRCHRVTNAPTLGDPQPWMATSPSRSPQPPFRWKCGTPTERRIRQAIHPQIQLPQPVLDAGKQQRFRINGAAPTGVDAKILNQRSPRTFSRRQAATTRYRAAGHTSRDRNSTSGKRVEARASTPQGGGYAATVGSSSEARPHTDPGSPQGPAAEDSGGRMGRGQHAAQVRGCP